MSVTTAADLEDALWRERVRLHADNAATNGGATILAATVLLAICWGRIDTARLLPWWALLVALLLARAGMALYQRRSGRADLRAWLWRYRLAYLVHGLLWGALSLWVLPAGEHRVVEIFTFASVAMAGAALVTGAFDPRASLLFVVATMVPVFVRLSALGETDLQIVSAAFVAMMGVASRRASALFVDRVQALWAEHQQVRQARRNAADAEAARRELADQHELTRQLIQGTAQGYWYIAPDGTTLDLNPAMCTLLGRAREEVIGRTVLEFFGDSARDVLERELERRRRGHKGGYEVDIVRPDGSRAHAFNNATPVYRADGSHMGSIGLWTDLTPIKLLERELRTYERVANSITDLVSVIGPDRCLRLVNDAWCTSAGVARAQVLGRPAVEHPLQLDPREPLGLVDRCFAQGGHDTHTVDAQLANGRAARLQTSCFPYRDGDSEVRAVILVTRDVTEQERDRAATEAVAEYLQRTLDATGDAIFASDASDPSQPLRLVNAQMLRLWNLDPERARSYAAADLWAALLPQLADPLAEQRRVAEVVQRNRPSEAVLPLRDGRVLHRRFQPAPEGAHPLQVWTFRDITTQERAHERLRHQEAELRALFDAFPGFIAATDAELRYQFVNPRAAELIGHPAHQLLGQRMPDVMPRERFSGLEAEVQRAAQGEVLMVDRRYAAGAGRGLVEVEVTVVAGPPGPGGRRMFYWFGVDVTARKRALDELARARDEAERANRAKSRFLSHMSHELRTPLNAIMGFAQLLERDRRAPLDAHQQGWVGQILRGAQHLSQLIGEVLDLARIEAGQVVLEPTFVTLPELGDECLAFVRELARSHDVRLLAPQWPAGPHTPVVAADRKRLKQVLLNLLANAIKYNRPGGDVQLGCRRDGAEQHLWVRDTGPGLSHEQQARLFQPFERLGAERGAVEGTGIGLLVSRHLVEAMGGRIGVDSRPGQGSEFWVRLPAAEAWAARPDDSRAPADVDLLGAPGPATVLCVDDNPVNLMLLEAMLDEACGLRAVCVDSPADALPQARRVRPQLVLLDIHMPGLSGYDVLGHLKADPELAGIPIVAVSADAHTHEIDTARAAGFADYLTKPIDLDALRAVLGRLLGGAGALPG